MKLAKLNNQPEIFYTIQGEGKNIGKPSVFLRTSQCNLHCSWCDTDYTWNWEGTPFNTRSNKKFKKENYIIEQSIDDITRIIEKFPCQHVVLTGGEPFMQQKELVELMNALKDINDDYTFEIETNGTLLPSDEFDLLIDQYNVSPKLSNSDNELKIREKPKPLSFFAKNDKAHFKFVISTKTDLNEVLELIKKYNINSSKVYLMPEGTNAQQLNEKQQWLVETCKQYGFNYTDRLHIHIYGSKRGV